MESSFRHKFASKPNVIQGNMEALKMSMEEVKSWLRRYPDDRGKEHK